MIERDNLCDFSNLWLLPTETEFALVPKQSLGNRLNEDYWLVLHTDDTTVPVRDESRSELRHGRLWNYFGDDTPRMPATDRRHS